MNASLPAVLIDALTAQLKLYQSYLATRSEQNRKSSVRSVATASSSFKRAHDYVTNRIRISKVSSIALCWTDSATLDTTAPANHLAAARDFFCWNLTICALFDCVWFALLFGPVNSNLSAIYAYIKILPALEAYFSATAANRLQLLSKELPHVLGTARLGTPAPIWI
jgi:hypothetical protein